MRSSEKTLLAKLGFADKDKKHPLHDRACQYVSQEEIAMRLYHLVIADQVHDAARKIINERSRLGAVSGSEFLEAKNEVLLAKGSGQYRTTIGFLDVVIEFQAIMDAWQDSYEKTGSFPRKEIRIPITGFQEFSLIIEVKAGETPIGDILRQMNLYRDHYQARQYLGYVNVPKDHWAVATVYQMAPIDVSTLLNAGYQHIQLGDHFKSWVEKVKTEKITENQGSINL